MQPVPGPDPCPPTRFVTSTIIGATSLPQLKENIDAFSIELSKVCWLAGGWGQLPAKGRERRVVGWVMMGLLVLRAGLRRWCDGASGALGGPPRPLQWAAGHCLASVRHRGGY